MVKIETMEACENRDENSDKENGVEGKESLLSLFLRRAYIVIIAVFLIVLLLASTNAGYHLISVLSGKIVSSSVHDYKFDLKGRGVVFFDKPIWDALAALYRQTQKTEFKACLLGYKNNSGYYVNNMYLPQVLKQDVFSVTAKACSNETIISLHSHPQLRCIFSEQDIKSYRQAKLINNQAIIALMCGDDRLSFFGY